MITIKIYDMNKDDVQKSYKKIREEYGKNINKCLRYLLEFKQNGLIHHIAGMDNLTTVEKQYILSLMNDET